MNRPSPITHGADAGRHVPAAPRPGGGGAGTAGHGNQAGVAGVGVGAVTAASAASLSSSGRRARRRQQQEQRQQDDPKNPLPKPGLPGGRPPNLPPVGRHRPWLLLALAPVPPLPPPAVPRPRAFFRYWIDSQALSSAASTVLLERALVALGGRRTGGPPKLEDEGGGGGRRAAADAAAAAAAAALSAAPRRLQQHHPHYPTAFPPPSSRDYGYMHMGEWDFLWSITAKAMLAAEVLRPGQLVSVVPGCLSVSRKTSLVRSLAQAYGRSAAFSVVPETFKLPEELDAWARALEREGREEGETAAAAAAAAAAAGAAAGQQQQQQHRPPPGGGAPTAHLWMLKNNKQRGTGLRLVRGGPQAFGAAFETAYRPGKMAGLPLYRWYLAQRYVSDPLLLRPYGGTADWIDPQRCEQGDDAAGARAGGGAAGAARAGRRRPAGGAAAAAAAAAPAALLPPPRLDNRPRKFGLRLWAIVPSAAPPFRAYIHQRGLALFSSRAYSSDPWAAAAPPAEEQGGGRGGEEGEEGEEDGRPRRAPPPPPPVPEGHLTNAARNAGAPVWPLHRVAEALGPAAWRDLWEALCRASALALAASRRRVRELRAELALPRGAAFQLFGLDFVVDASLRPWLLEVNATPSMRVDHPCPESAGVVEREKWPAVWDALALLRVAPERFVPPPPFSPSPSSSSAAAAALRRRGRRGAGGQEQGCDDEEDLGDEDAARRSGRAGQRVQRRRRWLPFVGRRAGGGGPGAGKEEEGEEEGDHDRSPYLAEDAPEASIADVAAEMRRAGGYVPLTHLFPDADTLPGCSVPWTPADDALRRWLRRQQRGGGEESWHAWRRHGDDGWPGDGGWAGA